MYRPFDLWHEVEDVVEQMQDDLLEAEEMISDEPQAKDEPTVGGNFPALVQIAVLERTEGLTKWE